MTVSKDCAAVDFGDWLHTTLHTITNSMGDISANSSIWWQEVLQCISTFYEDYVKVDQFKRLTMEPKPTAELTLDKWQRVDRHAATMLVGAVSEPIRLELVASRVQSTLAILCRLAILYRPGSSTERAQLLRHLENPDPATNPLEAVQKLRQWGRYLQRARAL